MPRYKTIPDAVAPIISLAPPPPPSPIIVKLRTDWRWAAISQFIWTFSDAFGLIDWDIENLETDMDGDEQAVLPHLLAKLLFVLTYNRQINRDNVFENLRKTYLKRIPDRTPLGTIEEPVDWATLGLTQKVQILHELCEWQLDNPGRFRALLKTQDEEATWRVEPLGWDKAGNTYYLFDDNRLWIQRIPPAPPRAPKKTSLKAKRAERAIRRTKPPPKKSHKKKVAAKATAPSAVEEEEEEEVVSGPRRRTQVNFYGNLTPTVAALKRGGNNVTPSSSRGTRSSTRLQPGSAPAPTHMDTPSKTRSTPLPLGTRVSRRLRNVEDEWQQVPDEWLSPSKEGKNLDLKPLSKARTNGRGKAKKREVEEESELSDLTDEEEHEARLKAIRKEEPEVRAEEAQIEVDSDEALTPAPEEEDTPRPDVEMESSSPVKPQPVGEDDEALTEEEDAVDEQDEDVKAEDEAESKTTAAVEEVVEDEADEETAAKVKEEEEMDEVKLAMKKATELPEGFVEWEAVCVTLYDWRTFPEQFAKSRDPDEKALYKILDQVAPTIIEGLVAKEQERLRQAAVLNRKRSSRIATKELEKEEEQRIIKAQREMEDRMSAQQRQEDRQAREEALAISQEKAREDRLKEREDRAAARVEAAQQKLLDEQEEEERAILARADRKRKREMGGTVSGSNTPNPAGDAAERWELACEVCQKNGWNIDGDDDLVCCDDCGRWQHTECHDRLDAQQGRTKRNWDKVDFQCQECRRKAARKRQRTESAQQAISNGQSSHQAVNGSKSAPARSGGHSGPDHRNGSHTQPPPHTLPPNAAGYPVHYPSQSGPPPGYPAQSAPSAPQMYHQASNGSNGHHRSALPPQHSPRDIPQPPPHSLPPRPSPDARSGRPVLPPLHEATGYASAPSHHYPAPVAGPPVHAHHAYPPQQMHPQHYAQAPPQAYHQAPPHHPPPPHPHQQAPRIMHHHPGHPPQGYQYHPQHHPQQQPIHPQQWQPQPYRTSQSLSGHPGHPLPPMNGPSGVYRHDGLNGHHGSLQSRGSVKSHEHVQQ